MSEDSNEDMDGEQSIETPPKVNMQRKSLNSGNTPTKVKQKV